MHAFLSNAMRFVYFHSFNEIFFLITDKMIPVNQSFTVLKGQQLYHLVIIFKGDV